MRAKVQHQISHKGRAIVSRILSVVRTGPEKVLIIPPVARGGNWLYEWMRAYSDSIISRESVTITKKQGMDQWTAEFPMLQQLTIDEKDIRFRSKREIGVHPHIHSDFQLHEIKKFIQNVLLASPSFQERRQLAASCVDNKTLVINVRRGDYYSDPSISHEFGINTIEYVRKATSEVIKLYEVKKIVVVSDDLAWCSQNLNFLQETSHTIFTKIGRDMFDDLAVLSVASLLILTNTTFGYWGGYIATVTHEPKVWVPNIHQRATSDLERPPQHMSQWKAVKPKHNSWLENK